MELHACTKAGEIVIERAVVFLGGAADRMLDWAVKAF